MGGQGCGKALNGKGGGGDASSPDNVPSTWPRGCGGKGTFAPDRKCFNCGDWGHYSTHCDKPPRMGDDMYPLLVGLKNRLIELMIIILK